MGPPSDDGPGLGEMGPPSDDGPGLGEMGPPHQMMGQVLGRWVLPIR